MSKSNYDPYTMVIKEIPELITELNSLIMKKLPGGRPVATVWGVLCEAARMHKEAEPDGNEKQEDTWINGFHLGREAGQSYAAHVIIRKIADGMGVDNFKLREVPLEPTLSGPEQGGHPGPGEADQPGGPGVVDGNVLAGRVPVDLPEHGPSRDEA